MMKSLQKPLSFYSSAILCLLLSGCNSHYCIFYCTNQATLQYEYEDSRDVCRELAELKMANLEYGNTAGHQGSYQSSNLDKDDKSRLVGLFSKCMNSKGWLVPGPGEDDKPAVVADSGIVSPVAPLPLRTIPAPTQQQKTAELSRASECAFARQAADSSVIARKRAQACDLECRAAKRDNPALLSHPTCP